jgi:hypothetical protein
VTVVFSRVRGLEIVSKESVMALRTVVILVAVPYVYAASHAQWVVVSQWVASPAR